MAAITLIAATGLVLATLLIAWSGLFNVAASRGHWAIVEWFLAFVMRNSVETRALAVSVPPLDDRDLVRLGAGHFHGGCAYCHGAPTTPISPVARHMLPPPPDLSTAARDWKAGELFWIVKHGIKYTGMPSWVALDRDDEVWAVVAFLRKLPDLDAQRYRDLALGGVRVAEPSGRELATSQSAAEAVGACARCHGADDRGPASALVPILHGQPAEFVRSALQSYAAGRRKSGIMQPIASDLSADAVRRLAKYYAGLGQPSAKHPRSAAGAEALDRGRKLALEGIPAENVPPCMPCHGSGALATYPRLAGQQARYMAGQLRLWKRGLRTSTAGAAIMAPIAARLTEQQIEDVSAYLATIPREGERQSEVRPQ